MNDYIIQIDSYDFEERLESGMALVYFCEYMNTGSRAIEIVMDEIAEKYADRIRVYAVDAEQSPDILLHYGVESIPCVIFLRNGDPVESVEGANLSDIYEEIIEELLSC